MNSKTRQWMTGVLILSLIVLEAKTGELSYSATETIITSIIAIGAVAMIFKSISK